MAHGCPGVPTTTIKFYIHENLLPAGTRSHRNQATYGEDHLRRLDMKQRLMSG
ncbi:MAG: MerR family transcriptional regulator [Gammaproteobacteria bacterium]|nr:MAG: MerR family transcriptional regulator [Gammaproteobacteria bacterium]